ncbi:hypothetical protein KI688_000698 [Linnemannia hyalina]|uniref:F-box domain-containing protein n=1 Tax=Linnemannia hyalina TaxID=64524 RepID=A0A9P7Y549_9FUNG|nr:hypothetical protein KI688_000698 [Linnemannia hyalina]
MMASDNPGIPETLALRPSPLNIPELLHQIFYFFDDFELTRHVLPVCRLWFLLNQHLIAREAHFDETQPSEELEQVILGLPWATRLCWGGGVIRKATRVQQRRYRRQVTAVLKDKHDDFMDKRFLRFRPVKGDGMVVGNHHIGEGGFYRYGSGGLDGLVQGSKAPLRELLVCGSISYLARVEPLLPLLSTLRRLELRFASGYLDLNVLFRGAPSLEALDIRCHATLIGDLWGKLFNQFRGEQPLLLRSIIFGHVQFPQAGVEAMVSMSPQLRELVLFDIAMTNYSWTGKKTRNFPLKLLDHIQSLSLPLERLYISDREDPMTPEFLSHQLKICPLKGEFFTWDLTLDVIQVIQQIPNIITTLEIAAPGQCGLDSTLHNYLCSSPHLLHLRAPKIEYQVNRMDFHRRLSDTNTTRFHRFPALGQPQIWACSNLQTLHLGIYSFGDSPPLDPTFNEQGRVLFGYIPRVTPRLQELCLNLSPHLSSNGASPRLCLESGLCLLTKLTRLVKLRVAGELTRQVNVPEDIEWMLQSGHSLEMRARRRTIVAGWDAQIEEEARKLDVQQLELHQQQEDVQQQQEQNGDGQQQQQNGHHPQQQHIGPQQQQNGQHQEQNGQLQQQRQNGQQQQRQQQQQQQQEEAPVISSELAEQLQNLGRLKDVMMMIEEMDSKEGFPYWSELRRVSLFSDSEFGLPVERECQMELARLA